MMVQVRIRIKSYLKINNQQAMKNTIISVMLLIITNNFGYSQAPQGFNYQAVARDVDGQVLSETQLGVSISILAGSADGSVIYTETPDVTTSPQGLFNIRIGSGAVQTGVFQEINWGADALFISVAISTNGSSDFIQVGTQQLLSVPYALFAAESGNNANTSQECPGGFTAVNDKYCIQTDEQVAANWFEANIQCAELNAEICSWSQWYYACQKSSLGLLNMTNNWEWINDGGDDKSNHAKAVGADKCTADDSFKAEFSNNAFRCCFSR